MALPQGVSFRNFIASDGRVIPLLAKGEAITPAYIAALSSAIASDGCTMVSEIAHHCCVVHDLGYRYAIDPWGRTIDRRTTDANFRKCIQAASPLGKFSPTSWVRWLGVRVFGRFVYHPTTSAKEAV